MKTQNQAILNNKFFGLPCCSAKDFRKGITLRAKFLRQPLESFEQEETEMGGVIINVLSERN